jgi:hypothetical protein
MMMNRDLSTQNSAQRALTKISGIFRERRINFRVDIYMFFCSFFSNYIFVIQPQKTLGMMSEITNFFKYEIRWYLILILLRLNYILSVG